MRRKVAVLFPGQGTQYVGMLNIAGPQQSQLVAIAQKVLGYDLAGLIQRGPTSVLNHTAVTQPAILLTSLCHFSDFSSRHPQIINGEWDVVMAGHSVGEYAALTASGIMTPEQAFRLIVLCTLPIDYCLSLVL